MSLIEKLQWRASIKKYDHSKKLSDTQLNQLLDAVRLAPSSLGLQHYKVLIIDNPAVREKLRGAGFAQAAITDASHLIVFAAETNMDEDFGKKYIDLVASTRDVARESLAGYEQMVLGSINSLSQEQKVIWAQKQAYIGLGVLLTAAAELGIDATPMEGFSADQFDDILGLKEQHLKATVIAAIGIRADDDFYSKQIKVRRPKAEMFIHV